MDNKFEANFALFFAILFGVLAALAIVGIWWNPSQYIIAGICALMCWAFIREYKIKKPTK